MSSAADTAKSPPTTGGRPRTCPTCNRLFQNSRGYHKHTLKCIRGQKTEAVALGGEKAAESEVQQQQLNEPKQNHHPAMEQGENALEKKDSVVDMEGDSVRKTLEGDIVVRKVGGGRGRRGRMRSLSATSVPSGLSEGGDKSYSASTSPAGTPSVQTRSRSYRGGRGGTIATEAGLRRKRGWHKGTEESDRKRQSLPSGDPALFSNESKLPKKTAEHEGSRRGRRGWRGRGRPPKHASRMDRGGRLGRGGLEEGRPPYESMEHGIDYVTMESVAAAAAQLAQGLGSPPHAPSSVRSPAAGDQSGGPVYPLPKYSLLPGGTSVDGAGSMNESGSPKLKVSPISMSPPPTSPPIRSPVLGTDPMQPGLSDSDVGVGSTASTPASDSGGRKANVGERQADGKSETHKTSASDSRKKSPTGHHGERGKWKDKHSHGGRMAGERRQEGRGEKEESPSASDVVASRHPTQVLTVGAALSMSPSLLGSMENRSLGFPPEQGYGLQPTIPEGKSLERSSSAPGSNASPAMSPVSGLGDQSPPPHPPPEQQSCPTSPSTEVPSAQAIMAAEMHLKTLPEGTNFSVPLNQGPSMAAQSATYFLSGTPPVQGLEFMGQPPTTPHTQVFAFYPSDTLFRPRPSVVDSTPATTNIATDSVSAEAPPAAATSIVVPPPPPPPPLIPATSYQRSGAYPMVGDSSIPTTSAMRQMVMQPHQVAAGKGPYVGYSAIPQNSAAGMLEAMHSRQPLYPSFLLHHGHHPSHGVVHPLSQGMRAAPNMSSDIGYFSQFGYRTDAATRTTSTIERAMPTSSQTPPVANQVAMSEVHSLQYPPPVAMIEGQTEFQCTQCEKYFKNKKALNGHMRKHGGAHGHKSVVVKREPVDLSNGESELDTRGPHYPQDHMPHHHPVGHHGTSRVFTFSNTPQTLGSQPVRSMDALLEAAEQMRQREEEEQQKRDAAAVVLASGVSHLPARKRPENISIPGSPAVETERARRRRSMSPPLMSPRPSIYYNILSPKSSQPSTPGIRNRQSFDKDEEPPMIHVGMEYQAEVEDFCSGADPMEEKSREEAMWKPVEGLSEQEELIIDWYMEFACSEAIPYKGRNKEYALHVLQSLNYNIKAAVHALVMGKKVFGEDSPLTDYHYTGTSEWRPMEAKLFRRGFREHKKRFDIIQKDICGKNVNELHEYYYMWKKMKPAEYRGRQRHHSDDDLSYERLLGLDAYGPDDAFAEEGPNSPSSVDSGSSGSCSLSDERESVDSRARRFKGTHHRVVERRYTPDITAQMQSKNPYEKHWEPLQQKEGGSLLGEGKFHFESPSKSTKMSSLAKESKSSGSPSTSDSPKRQKINTKTADDRPGNYPCGFCGITFPSVKSRSAHMKKHKYEDSPQSHGQSTANKK